MAQLLLLLLLLHLHLLAAVSVTVVATDETHAIDSVGTDRAAAAGSHGGCTAESAMTLEMMPDKAQSDGAVCLDGSPGGYYIQTAKNKTNNWQICEPIQYRESPLPASATHICVALTNAASFWTARSALQILWAEGGATPRLTA
jgi:hypothetical protein